MFRQTTYVGPVFHPPINISKQQPVHHQPHQQQPRERQSQAHGGHGGRGGHGGHGGHGGPGGHGDGESSAPLERRPARRTNPATVSTGPPSNDTARPSSYQGDCHVTLDLRLTRATTTSPATPDLAFFSYAVTLTVPVSRYTALFINRRLYTTS